MITDSVTDTVTALSWARRLVCIAGLSCLFVAGCDGARTAGQEMSSCDPGGGNAAMFTALAGSCASCHGPGTARPFFASVTSFEDLLVYDTRYVVPGDPERSALVALLEGRGTGAYAQMPLAGDAFATLAARGETAVGMSEIRSWITALPPPDLSRSGPDPEAVTIRRLSADEYINALEVALGQDPNGGVPPLLNTEGLAPLAPDSPTGIDYQDSGRRQTYLMLGGPSYLGQRPPDTNWGPSGLLAVTQLAQGACVRAVERTEPTFFVHVTSTARLPEAEADVRENLAYLYSRFLHTPAEADEIDALYREVYVPAESVSPRVAWVQVCTALARDPLFITF